MSGQANYESDAAAVKGGRVVLRDFDKGARDDARDSLEAAGFEVVFAMSAADVVVVPEEPSRRVIKQAQSRGLPVMSLAQARELGGLGDVADLSQEHQRGLPRRAAIEVTEDSVRILDVVLPRRKEVGRAGRPASIESFSYLCLDEHFLITARNVAAAASFDIPCVLEGETATAKTTIIRWVAALVGQPVYRLNLNGQTDTSELVGRYVPASGRVELDTETLLRHVEEFDEGPEWARVRTDLLELQESRASGETRELNPIEQARIAKTLGLASKSWEFVEGYIPKALRHGSWVILDEMNLAEPQILERLNSVLEDNRGLVLTEGDGTRFGPNGDVKPHPEFRLFGTMNPAEYAGRSALSPAFRDRWRLWRFVDRPSESALHAMLRTLVYGEQPEFEYGGVMYRATATDPIYPEMQEIEGIDELLIRLASFHFQMANAAGDSGQAKLGRTRRERYVFTRRSLLTIMKLIHRVVCKGLAFADTDLSVSEMLQDLLIQVYVDRVQDEGDRSTILTAMRAAGLIGA